MYCWLACVVAYTQTAMIEKPIGGSMMRKPQVGFVPVAKAQSRLKSKISHLILLFLLLAVFSIPAHSLEISDFYRFQAGDYSQTHKMVILK